MQRRATVSISAPIRGGPRPWRYYKGAEVVHSTQRPGVSEDFDFSKVGLKYPMTCTPEYVIEKTMWSPPPKTLPNLPFAVDRSSTGLSLPVYTDYKAGGTKVITMLRKCRGDIRELKAEMEKVCGTIVEVKPGKLVVNGNYHRLLKKWLAGLGF